MNLLVYTDGGCSGNPGPGGWAYVIVKAADSANGAGDTGSACGHSGQETGQDIIAEKWGAERNTTNNRMELTAVISALDKLSGLGSIGDIKVFTDSQYVQKGMTVWIKDWKSRGWKTAGKDPVKNMDLWQHLDSLASSFTVSWHWVKGHSGNIYNERCDSFTQRAISSIL